MFFHTVHHYFQSRQEISTPDAAILHPEKLPKTRPSNPRHRLTDQMTQSCPTPPQARKKFFLSPKALRSPFLSRGARGQPDTTALSGKQQL